MSSPLPEDVRRDFDAIHRDRKGLYRCAGCGARFPRASIHIDHIKPEVDHPELKHEQRNLQPLCAPPGGGGCHRAKTSREARLRARQHGKQSVSWLAVLLVYLGVCGLTWLLEPRAARPLLLLALGPIVLLLAFRSAAWWAKQGAMTPAPAMQPAERTPDPRARVEAAVRDVVGQRGTVKVTGTVPARFTVHYDDTGFADHSDERRAELVDRLAAKTGARLRPTWHTAADAVVLEQRPDLPARVDHPGFSRDLPWSKLPIAPGLVFDLTVTAHILVIGATGAGKTVVLRSIVERFAHAARHAKAELHLADPKMIELIGFRGLAGVKTVATTDEELWALPLEMKAEMERRFALFRDEAVPLESHDPLLLVLDEYEEFVRRMTAYWPTLPKDDPHAKKTGMANPCLEAMKSVLSMARRGHIHVVIGTQRPDASWFGGSARDNLQGRIGVGPLSREAARMAFKTSEYGCDLPISAKGRVTAQAGDGEVVEAQAYWVPDRTSSTLEGRDRALLERLSA